MDSQQTYPDPTVLSGQQRQPVLTAAHFDLIENAERTLHDLLPELDKAQGCDVPGCDEMRARAKAYLAKLGKFKATYFPSGRP